MTASSDQQQNPATTNDHSPVESKRNSSSKTFKNVREMKTSSVPTLTALGQHNASVYSSGSNSSTYDEKHKCCCGSVHVKQGALLIAYLSIIIGGVIFGYLLYSAITSRNVSTYDWFNLVDNGLHIACAVLAVVAIRQVQPLLVLPLFVFKVLNALLVLSGAVLLLFAAVSPSSMPGMWLRRAIEADQEENMKIKHSDEYTETLVILVALILGLAALFFFLLLIWCAHVIFKCYRYLREVRTAVVDNILTKAPHADVESAL